MLSLPDTSDPLEEVFNNGSRALAEMQENIEKMGVKYGLASHLYNRQKFLWQCLADMQEAATKEINTQRQAYQLACINQQAQEMIITSLQSGMSERQLLEWASR
jgi:hypothetical protein